MSALSVELKKKAIEVGFVSVGITSPEMLQDLPYGQVGELLRLRTPAEELQAVKSVILLGWHAWDRTFSLNVDPPKDHVAGAHFESYFFCYEIMKNKAWVLVDFLRRRGFDAVWSLRIPLKTAAVKSGLGSQGKNSLLITPEFGPRVMLISVLTDAILETDLPSKEDLCNDCDKCIRVCPTKAIDPYNLNITRCMVYSSECPDSTEVPDNVRHLEKKLFVRPTATSFIECTRCIDVCPVGKR